jgi:hypothetical protein
MQRLEIFDVDPDGALNFDLGRVLASLPQEVRTYQCWCFKELEAVGNDLLQVEAEVQASPDGLCMDWDELVSLSKRIDETINLNLVGGNRSSSLGGTLEEALRIEVIDSTLWAIETDARPILEWLKTSFNRVSTI